MILWRIYYGDGATYSNEDGEPQNAPAGGVMCIAWYDEDRRRRLAHNSDYYIYAGEGRWYGCDAAGFWQYMAETGYKIVKLGRMIGDRAFREIMSKAMNDLPLEGVK